MPEPEPLKIGKAELIAKMEKYKPGIEADMLGRYLELCEPFTRFTPASEDEPFNKATLEACKSFDMQWHRKNNDDKEEENIQSQDSVGDFLGIGDWPQAINTKETSGLTEMQQKLRKNKEPDTRKVIVEKLDSTRRN